MKSQVLTILLWTIGVLLFQPTDQYRLQKRELTEYDLTSFIADSCSADKLDTVIQTLCDQTLESALMGNFPFLLYYCKMIGSENRYCKNVNRHAAAVQNIQAKRFASHRLVRSLNKNKNSKSNEQEMDADLDLNEKKIFALCVMKTEKNSIETNRFCDQTLQEGHPQIQRFCEFHPDYNYCRHLLSSSSFSRLLFEESSSLSSPSTTPNLNLSSVPLASSKLSDLESIINPEEMNKNITKSALL